MGGQRVGGAKARAAWSTAAPRYRNASRHAETHRLTSEAGGPPQIGPGRGAADSDERRQAGVHERRLGGLDKGLEAISARVIDERLQRAILASSLQESWRTVEPHRGVERRTAPHTPPKRCYGRSSAKGEEEKGGSSVEQ